MEGYQIAGHNADALKRVLDGAAPADQPLNYVSKLDGEEFARRLSTQTGRRFRIQTDPEWEAARHLLTVNLWTWTETKYSGNTFVLRLPGFDYRNLVNPEYRYHYGGLRLVEDL
jgi:formylglycine-generating enzyme required for sulfatase activity